MHKVISKTGWSNRGFTLSEVIIASLLLVVAMVPILQALAGAHRTDIAIERKTRSLQLAQAKVEDIRARSIYNYSTDFTDASSSVDGLYLCKVVDSAVTAELRAIDVSVGYDENGNDVLDSGEVHVTLNTLVAKRW